MSRIREAAAAFVEAGRAFGRYEQAKADIAYLEECNERGLHLDPKMSDPSNVAIADAIRSMVDFKRGNLPALAREATEYQMAAERLVAELEDGLAQRVVRVIAAARAAWRG
jgi:hypothetical protein